MRPGIERDANGKPRRVWVSAHSGEGLELIGEAVAEILGSDTLHQWWLLAPEQGRLRARLYAANAVLEERVGENGSSRLEVRASRSDLLRLLSHEVDDPEQFLRTDKDQSAG